MFTFNRIKQWKKRWPETIKSRRIPGIIIWPCFRFQLLLDETDENFEHYEITGRLNFNSSDPHRRKIPLLVDDGLVSPHNGVADDKSTLIGIRSYAFIPSPFNAKGPLMSQINKSWLWLISATGHGKCPRLNPHRIIVNVFDHNYISSAVVTAAE